MLNCSAHRSWHDLLTHFSVVGCCVLLLAGPRRSEAQTSAVTTPVDAADTDDRLPSGTISLQEALAAALLHNPELATYPFEIRAEEARALQEGLLPNPALSTELENFGRVGGGSGVEGSRTTISLTQLLELGGKREKRRTVAKLESKLASWDYERARVDVAAKTLKAFVGGLVAQERVALTGVLLKLAEDSAAAVHRQAGAGATSPVEVTRADAAVAQAQALRARREREFRAARVALATTWGSATPSFAALAGTLEPLRAPRPLAALRAELQANPDIARFGTAVARAQASVELEAARRIPDVTLRVGARRFISAEADAFVAELSVPLPLFNRNQGALQEAYERLGQTRAEEHAVTVGADTALSTTYEELVAAFEQAQDLRTQVLPRMRLALDGSRRGYVAGQLRYLDVLDAQRTVAEVQGEYLDALARYHASAADVERLTGVAATGTIGETR